METSIAQVQTPHAQKYLRQLAKHFAHKIPVTQSDNAAHLSFPFGACDLTASPAELCLTVTSEFVDLPRAERVVGDHLSRFAFRENPIIEWQRAASNT
ncbi:MAG: DUF2218 domain-containing protein [Rhodobacteraceae bacterium]|nr:DUF2218 domain-containing protein [Paracoccaceae bacterium]